MRRNSAIVVFLMAALLVPASARAFRSSGAAQSGEATDAVVVRIDGGGAILQSQVTKLGALQTLTQGIPDSRDRLIQELIDQWIVMNDAKESGFPAPSGQLVDIEESKVSGQFGSSEAYAAKLREVGLSTEDVRQMLSRQILTDRYFDHKFRSSVQIDKSAIETYYQKAWLPALSRENLSQVPLSEAQDQIREVLTQQEIRDRGAKWISDTKSHLKIEVAG
jgi:hypothetical protein